MTYQAFASDVLTVSPQFACAHAHRMGVPGHTMALWLSRLTLKTRAA